MLSLKSKFTKTTSGAGVKHLPILAVSPPSRPHTPQGQHPELPKPENEPLACPQLQLHSSSTPPSPPRSAPDYISTDPHHRPPTPPPRGPHSRARSYSVKNGLLSPDLSPTPDSSTPLWRSGSSQSDGESFISDDAWCESPTSTTFDDNPFHSTSSLSAGIGKEKAKAKANSSQKISPSDNHTVYHIYHSGPLQTHFSVHISSDSTSKPPKRNKKGKDADTEAGSSGIPCAAGSKSKSLPFVWQETDLDPRVPIYFLHKPRLNNHMPSMTLRWGGDGRDYIREKYIAPGKEAKVKKGKNKPEKRKRDMKYAPIVCHIEDKLFWRKWELEFTALVPSPDDPALQKPTDRMRDSTVCGYRYPGKETLKNAKGLEDQRKETTVFKGKDTKDKSNWVHRGLNEPGVVDGRGLISGWYPFRKGIFAWRALGETGKEWVEKELARRKAETMGMRRKSTSDINISAAEKCGDTQEVENSEKDQNQQNEDDSLVLLPPEKLPRHLWPIQLDPVPSSSPSPLPTDPKPAKKLDPKKGPPNPSKITLTWSNILFREYAFTYLSTSFYWRGTRELNHYPEGKDNLSHADRKKAVEEARKKKGVDFCVWAHLKLVARVPRRVVEEWEEDGFGLGLLGEKRRTRSWGVGKGGEGVGFGLSSGGSGSGAEEATKGEFQRVKRRNSSFSSLWSSVTKRNTIPSPDSETHESGSRSEGPEEERRLPTTHKSRPSIFSTFTFSRPTTPTPTTTPATPNPTPTSPAPSNPSSPHLPPRSSTWGTSTSTLVPWLTRSQTDLSNPKGKGKCTDDHEAENEDEREEMAEIVLARYSCVLSSRKAGRLVVDEDALGRVARWIYGNGGEEGRVRYINPPTEGSSPSPSPLASESKISAKEIQEEIEIQTEKETHQEKPQPSPTYKTYTTSAPTEVEDLSTQKERLRHIIIGTGLCMVIAEKEKRDTIKEILMAAASEGAGNA